MNTKEKLMQLLELCIEKGMYFSFSQHLNLDVIKFDSKNEFLFNETVYLYEWVSEEEKNIRIDDLITKVKNYQP